MAWNASSGAPRSPNWRKLYVPEALDEAHELLAALAAPVELNLRSPRDELRPAARPRPPGVGIPEALAGDVDRDDSRLFRFTLRLLPVPVHRDKHMALTFIQSGRSVSVCSFKTEDTHCVPSFSVFGHNMDLEGLTRQMWIFQFSPLPSCLFCIIKQQLQLSATDFLSLVWCRHLKFCRFWMQTRKAF